MTVDHVGAVAPGSLSPRVRARGFRGNIKPWERTTVRFTWLVMRLTRGEDISLPVYQARFARSVRSYRRDLAVLREAGLYLDSDGHGHFRLVCFRADAAAA